MRSPSANPHAAFAVAVLALVVAAGGSAVAVTKASNGDHLIAKHTLSANRLRDHTVTSAQLKPLVWHNVTLINGWKNYYSSRPPAYAVDAQGIVHLRGAIHETTGSSSTFGRIANGVRPSVDLWIATDLVNAAPGRISIDTDGTLYAQSDGPAADAEDFTNLEGITYSLK